MGSVTVYAMTAWERKDATSIRKWTGCTALLLGLVLALNLLVFGMPSGLRGGGWMASPVGPYAFVCSLLLACILVATGRCAMVLSRFWEDYKIRHRQYLHQGDLCYLLAAWPGFGGILAGIALFLRLTWLVVVILPFQEWGVGERWYVTTYSIESLRFTPDSRTLLARTTKGQNAWAVENGTPRGGESGLFEASQLVPPNLLAKEAIKIEKNNKTWSLQDSTTGRELARFDPVYGGERCLHAFSPDGRYLATQGGLGVQLWGLPAAASGGKGETTEGLGWYWLIYLGGVASIGLWIKLYLASEDKNPQRKEDLGPVEPAADHPPLSVPDRPEDPKTCPKCGQVSLSSMARRCRQCGSELP